MRDIVIIIDKSPSYLSFKRDIHLSEWGVDKSHLREVDNLSMAFNEDLFGGAPVNIMNIDTVDAAKKLATDFEKISVKDLEILRTSGLIIMISVSRTYTKKIEAFSKKNNLLLSIPPAKNDSPLSHKLVEEFGFTRDVKDFLLSYIGDDYEMVIPLLTSLYKIPKDKQRVITIDDLKIRLPKPPGAVPPWEIEPFILNGDVIKSIEMSRRIDVNSSFLVWLSIVKGKFETYTKVATLLQDNPRLSDGSICEALNIPTRGFYYTKKTVKSYSVETFIKVLELLVLREAQLKGDSAAPPKSLVEKTIIELCELFKNGRV